MMRVNPQQFPAEAESMMKLDYVGQLYYVYECSVSLGMERVYGFFCVQTDSILYCYTINPDLKGLWLGSG